MTTSEQVRFIARIAAFCFACAALPYAAANPNARATASGQTCGSQGDPIEVVLPYEMQASYLHSPPIAGLLVMPDDLAQRMITTPRVPPTTARPLSGKSGLEHPISRSRNVGRRADQIL
jgi:hypothetical protein